MVAAADAITHAAAGQFRERRPARGRGDLGELYDAVAKSNSAVGGRVLQKGSAEYLIRSVGWIESIDDLRRLDVRQPSS